MVSVFKTNVYTEAKAESIIKMLKSKLSECEINFDLEDCDKILRIEGVNINEQKIIELLHINKIQCEELI